jgi:calcium channel MID1
MERFSRRGRRTLATSTPPPTVTLERDTTPWRRRRKPFSFSPHTLAALLLYTLTVVLVPPWRGGFARAEELLAGGDDHTVLYRGGGAPFGGLEMGGGYEMLNGVGLGGDAGLDRRATKIQPVTQDQENGIVKLLNIEWGGMFIHHLSAAEVFNGGRNERRNEIEGRADDDDGDDDEVTTGRRVEIRQDRRKTIHLTFNTCLQPQPNSTAKQASAPEAPPQLMVFVSNSTDNKAPGARVDKPQFTVNVDHGFAAFDFDATGDVWVGVYAPRLSSTQKGVYDDEPWNYELALTTGEPYHGFKEEQFLYLVDTDDSTALLITGNMTATAAQYGGVKETLSVPELMATNPPPYTMYAQNRNITSKFNGLEKSYCAVRLSSQIRPGATDVSMTTRGLGNLPKQQFHLNELNRSSEYLGYLARPRSNKTDDTSGILWKPTDLNTKKDGNCQIIYNLPFCSEVAYAVPSNPTIFSNLTNLTTFYDDIANNWWNKFSYSLQQIQCNATSSAEFSLVRDCDDCAGSYKNWLCAVTIPRCMDYSSTLPYLASRSSTKLFWNETANGWQKHPFMPLLNQTQVDNFVRSGGWEAGAGGNQSTSKVSSRNPKIDEIVKPGAYKEVKPCKDLCWSLVQGCPSPLGFQCPRDGSWGKEMSYGERDGEGDVTCSYLGAVYFLSAAGKINAAAAARLRWVTVLTMLVGLLGGA